MDYIDTKNNDNDYLDTRLPAEPELKRIAEEYILEADSSYDWTMGEEFDTSDGSHRSSAWPEENSEDEIRDNSDTTLFLTPPPMPLSMLGKSHYHLPPRFWSSEIPRLFPKQLPLF